MATNERIQFPDPDSVGGEFTDYFGQRWIWNDVAWVRRGIDPGVEEAPKNGQQHARVNPYDKDDPENPGEKIPLDGYWELVQADEWYLGAHETDPQTDNFGSELLEGHTYYNTLDKTMYVYNGTTWSAFSGVSEIATLWEYRFDNIDLSTAGDGTAVIIDVAAGDDHSNTPFDVWERGTIIVTVYVDGERVVERRELTPSFGDPSNPVPSRPSDEVDQIQVADAAGLPDPGTVDQAYVTLDNGYTWISDGANNYTRGGVELDRYDYTVDYENQTIRFIQNFTASSEVVIETGTLAASEYIKRSYIDATDWDFVKHDCDMGGSSAATAFLPSQKAVKCFVDAQIEAAKASISDALIGSIFDWGGSVAPTNAMALDNNTELSQHMYPKLYAAIGTTWNNWNGNVTSSGFFRLPPQSIDGNPLYYAGTTLNDSIGTFLGNQNKIHAHTNKHNHEGSRTNKAGNHKHDIPHLHHSAAYASGRGGAYQYDTKYDGDDTAYAGEHDHSISIANANITTSENGGATARPDTVIALKCIWVDSEPQ